MRKGLLAVIVLALVLSACANKDAANDKGQPPTIQEYFPMKENTGYIYEGKGNEYAAYDVFNDYIAEGRVQQRIDNGGTVVARVIELKSGSLTQLLSKGEAYYRENLLKATDIKVEILLMEPLEKGTTWTLDDSRVRMITNTSADVSTPSGDYEAIEVTTKGPNETSIEYYAKDVGLVKSVFNPGEFEISSFLSKIEADTQLMQSISFYYPGKDDGKIHEIVKDVGFNTNDITRAVLAEAYKQTPSDLLPVFTKNTRINNLYLNKDGMVYLDLNSAFLEETNAGAGYEELILQSIVNTFGKYYNATKVILTIDNKLYESGHFAFKKGEYLKVSP